MRFLRHGRLTVLTAIAIGLLAGGVAYASIPGPGGVISGCYKKVGGALRVIDAGAGMSCSPSETPLDWNQQGPTGPTGSAGPAGPAGPSEGWDGQASATLPAYPDSVVLNGGATGIPAGSYLISGQVDADRLGSGSAEIRCFLDWTGGGSSDAAVLYVSSTSGDAAPMTGEMTVDSTTTLTVDCQELFGGTPGISVVARVHAIRVGTLHQD